MNSLSHPSVRLAQLATSSTKRASYLQALDGESQHAGRQLGRLLEGEVAPVDDEDEAVDLQLRVLDHGLQRQQDGPQNVHKGVSAEVRGQRVSI